MLHKVIGAGPLFLCLGHKLAYAVELVIPGEDHRHLLDLFVAQLLLLHLQVDKPREDVQKAAALEHLVPEIGRLVAAGIVRVAAPAVTSLVERQKVCLTRRQPRGHVDLVGVHGEMHQGPFLELEDEVGGVAVVLVLRHRVPPRLRGHGILEFGSGHRDAVQRQRHIKGIVVLRGVPKLAGHRQPVRLIPFQRLGVHAAGGGKVGDVEPFSEALETMPEHRKASLVFRVQRAA